MIAWIKMAKEAAKKDEEAHQAKIVALQPGQLLEAKMPAQIEIHVHADSVLSPETIASLEEAAKKMHEALNPSYTYASHDSIEVGQDFSHPMLIDPKGFDEHQDPKTLNMHWEKVTDSKGEVSYKGSSSKANVLPAQAASVGSTLVALGLSVEEVSPVFVAGEVPRITLELIGSKEAVLALLAVVTKST